MDLSGIDCLICPSQYMANKLAYLGRPLTVIPNFVPPPPDTIADIDNPGYFLYLGVLEPHKGIKELLKAFAGNRQRLILVGRGSLAEYVNREIAKNKLSPRIQYKGWAEDKWPLLKGACALILPSLWPENSPLSVLEAMSVGTPTFCTDMGGTKEIVEKIPGGLVIPAKDIEIRLRDITIHAISKESIIKAYQVHFSAEKYINDYLEIARNCS